MSDEKKDNQLAALSSLNVKMVFSDSIESFDNEQAASAWMMIDLLEDVVKERKAALRESLLKRVQEKENLKKNGSYEVAMGGVSVTSEYRRAKLPDEDVVKECLKEAGLKHEHAFICKEMWVMDPSKVEFLVQGGMIDEKKIEASRKVSYALKMKADKEIKGKLGDIKLKLTGEK